MLTAELSKAKESLLVQLKRKKQRYEKGLFVAEGEKCVWETIQYFTCKFMVITDDVIKHPSSLSEELNRANIPIYTVPEHVMKKISSFATPSRILGCFQLPETHGVPDCLEKYELMLDGIQDPGNLGTIIRTADWFGFNRIFASYDTADQFNAKTVQAAMGSCGRVSLIYCNLADVVHRFPSNPLVSLVLDGESIYKTPIPERGIIVMGNEGNGVSNELQSLTSVPLKIPSFPEDARTAESLNVAVATAITLAEFRRVESNRNE